MLVVDNHNQKITLAKFNQSLASPMNDARVSSPPPPYFNIDLEVGGSLFPTLIQILELSVFDLLFMFFSDVMQSIFFMNEFLATFMTLYYGKMVDMPSMAN